MKHNMKLISSSENAQRWYCETCGRMEIRKSNGEVIVEIPGNEHTLSADNAEGER